jgi:hypothetical protein
VQDVYPNWGVYVVDGLDGHITSLVRVELVSNTQRAIFVRMQLSSRRQSHHNRGIDPSQSCRNILRVRDGRCLMILCCRLG